jgi:hypothetical protein
VFGAVLGEPREYCFIHQPFFGGKVIYREVHHLWFYFSGYALRIALHHRGVQLVQTLDEFGMLLVKDFHAHGILLGPL